ncbi:MAG: glycosyltransferase family 39 protein, partial [Pyrinomonadaceae bacterium]
MAVNLLDHHVLSANSEAPFTPTLIRLPGYPLFIAGVYAIFGRGDDTAVRIIQALIHTVTCGLIAFIAFSWVEDRRWRLRASLAAFGLAALCPFTAIFAATILTEILATFFLAAMTLAATFAIKTPKRSPSIAWWCVAGAIAGISIFF